MQLSIYEQGRVSVTIAAAESIAVATLGTAIVSRVVGSPNRPDVVTLQGVVNNSQTVFGPFATGATILIEAGAAPVLYETGTTPVVQSLYNSQIQATPVALDATGPITTTSMLGGIVTSTTGAVVSGTLPTGTVMDLASEFAVNDSFDWSVINTGGTNAFIVASATGHTIVGSATVGLTTSGRFRTRKTAANTFVTYRVA